MRAWRSYACLAALAVLQIGPTACLEGLTEPSSTADPFAFCWNIGALYCAVPFGPQSLRNQGWQGFCAGPVTYATHGTAVVGYVGVVGQGIFPPLSTSREADAACRSGGANICDHIVRCTNGRE